MTIKKYDGKIIKLETIYGNVFEGIGYFYSDEYNNHEFGVNEDSIQMSHFVIYKSQIKSIKIIKEFSNNYGELEEKIIESDLDIVEEVFDSDDDISIYRLLLCIENNLSVFDNIELVRLLNNLVKYNDNIDIIKRSNNIIDLLSNNN